MSKKLFKKTSLANIALNNHIVMAPMTRCRAIDNIPNDLMAKYYRQRAGAGLIITEGTAPSPDGLGYARIPGIFNQKQAEGWEKVTKAVHEEDGKIFIQLMHTGRVSHPANLPKKGEVIAPSEVRLESEQMWTDSNGMQDYPTPKRIPLRNIPPIIDEYVNAANYAMEAGFDGVEIHGANGYLVDQFINPTTNQRADNYGGSPGNRIRFAREVTEAISNSIGKDKTGIRLSPHGVFNGMGIHESLAETYDLLSFALNNLDIAYIHLVNHSSMGAPEVPTAIVKQIRNNFKNTLILSGGYDAERAEKDLQSGQADLVAFGRPFLANPDLVERFQQNAPLNDPDQDTFYTAGAEGYTDYPTLKEEQVEV